MTMASGHDSHAGLILREALEQEMPPAVEQALRDRMAGFRRQASRPRVVRTPRWRRAVPVGAVAVGLVVAAVLWFGEREDGPGAVYAAALQEARAARTARFTTVAEEAGQAAQTMECTFMAPAKMRVELPRGSAAVVDFDEGKILVIDRSTKTFTVIQLDGLPATDNFMERLRSLPERYEDVEFLGTRTDAGGTAQGFRVRKDGMTVTVWIDPATGSLTRAVFQGPGISVTMSDFAFDVPVDEDLMGLQPPEGYTLREQNLDFGTVRDGVLNGGPPGVPAGAEEGVVYLAPSQSLTQGVFVDGGLYRAKGERIQNLIRHAYGFGRERTIANVPLPKGVYDVFLRMPEGQEGQLWETLRSGLRAKIEEEFGITGRVEMREAQVYLLTAPAGQAHSLREPESTPRAFVMPPRFRNMGVASLGPVLGGRLNRPVIDETGLGGRYDFEFSSDQDDFDSVRKAVQEQLGLDLEPALRKVEFLVIE